MKTTINTEIYNLVESIRRGKTPTVYCPECGRGGMQEGIGGWECVWRDCHFTTDKIPSILTIHKLFELKKELDLIKKYAI